MRCWNRNLRKVISKPWYDELQLKFGSKNILDEIFKSFKFGQGFHHNIFEAFVSTKSLHPITVVNISQFILLNNSSDSSSVLRYHEKKIDANTREQKWKLKCERIRDRHVSEFLFHSRSITDHSHLIKFDMFKSVLWRA